jgi:hypothetical protein
MADPSTLSDERIARLGVQMGVGGNIGIEAAHSDEQKQNRARLIAFARAILAASRSEPDGPPNAESGTIPLQAMLDAIDDAPYLSLEQDRWLTQRARSLAAESRGSASVKGQYRLAEVMPTGAELAAHKERPTLHSTEE